ncbi:MAG: hypothetical protein MJE77_43710 [Proteobacteria bacterium]|nr:hypothetical protein [Pseudomonadota bacterium]
MKLATLRPSVVLVAAGVAVAIAAYVRWSDRSEVTDSRSQDSHGSTTSLAAPVRPARPPVPGRDTPRRPAEPLPPPLAPGELAEVYESAVAAGEARPGERAFRANVTAFIQYNKAFAEDQANREGLSVAEVQELTYLGFLVKQTQSWSEVEELIGHDLSPDQRQAGEKLMHDINSAFKAAMRQLVADGADPAHRWDLIRATTKRYKDDYFAITGMNPDLLDDLLAGDLRREYSPSVTPVPDEIPHNPDYRPPSERPERGE